MGLENVCLTGRIDSVDWEQNDDDYGMKYLDKWTALIIVSHRRNHQYNFGCVYSC